MEYCYFEKSLIIDLIQYIIEGNESKTLHLYRGIYNSGVEPKVFLNEYLETLYYLKNIDFINLDGANFDLNDKEFEKIKALSSKFAKKDLLLLWQFTLNNLEKIDIIKNQHHFIEMFLIRSLYLKKILKAEKQIEKEETKQELNINKTILDNNNKPQKEVIDQLKNVEQEEKIISTPEVKNNIEEIQIKSLKDLVKVCEEKKELKIKYELENNLRLVSFDFQKIEISFNSNLDKTFVKELSALLQGWTNKRWIIALSKKNGLPTLKEQKKKSQSITFKKQSNSNFSNEVKKIFPDAELLNLEEDDK